jgi:cell wall-associated NlpC family hydrolase
MPGPSFHYNHKTGKLEYPTGHTKPSGEAVTTTNPTKAYVRPPSVPIGSPTPSPSRPSPTRYTPRTAPTGILNTLSDLITPGPSAKETAEAAHRLGVRPQEAPSSLGEAAGSLIHTAAQGINKITQDAASIPKQRVSSVLGRKTLGTPTVGQVVKAATKTPLFTQEGPTKLYKDAYSHNKSLAKPGPYQTQLAPEEERQFRHWVAAHSVPFNPEAKHTDYDMRGFWKATSGKGWKKGEHFPDTFKTPLDTTFSAQSRYANKRNHQVWRGNKLVDSRTGKVIFDESGGRGLRVNKRGELTVPATRRAVNRLATAKSRVAHSGANPAALARQFPELNPAKIRALGEAQRRTGTPAALLAGILSQESDYGRSTLPGVHSGQNFAGAAGPYQIGNGTGASGDAWQQVAQELWGPNAAKHSIYNFRDASLGAGQYLQTFPSTPATKNPATWYNAALSYNHAGWYAEAVKREAEKHLALSKAGRPPDPKAVQQFVQAKLAAGRAGIPVKAGDTGPGPAPQTVFVRADAEGMVQWAKALLGTQEGSRLQLKWAAQSGVSAAEPWCSEFIAAGMARRGLPAPENPAYSGTWLSWKGGSNIGTNLQQAKPGDILVFGPASSTAHVGLYIGNGQMISGNYGNEVAQAPVSQETASEPIAGIVRPHFKGGKVAVKESAVLPGAAIGPSGELVSGPAGVGASGAASGESGARPGVIGATSLNALNPLLTPNTEVNLQGEGEPEDIVQAILRRRRG